ncbi:hypothetical protein TBLA_0I00460 [Henningerozyma blattae CBS 6284]|uniref:SEC7 domain-containing protein n=1 Tax=Henningerozyma blattae (strain ATCC 34711 / CBS 6284 / DSM 70876 / NBRC 10599 / NRRL Y-10934 / UCD 77-7) TaxID=1071380 RepID=I2H8K6_HENB6|nr:hypothetical protein TBLA_0I00460 [Tetrapisispora blattae CBS 6284]CCH62708.1 hypothetical protein TBLA_0I00460 [Tetrapisispora blattae CBS 6284]
MSSSVSNYNNSNASQCKYKYNNTNQYKSPDLYNQDDSIISMSSITTPKDNIINDSLYESSNRDSNNTIINPKGTSDNYTSANQNSKSSLNANITAETIYSNSYISIDLDSFENQCNNRNSPTAFIKRPTPDTLTSPTSLRNTASLNPNIDSYISIDSSSNNDTSNDSLYQNAHSSFPSVRTNPTPSSRFNSKRNSTLLNNTNNNNNNNNNNSNSKETIMHPQRPPIPSMQRTINLNNSKTIENAINAIDLAATAKENVAAAIPNGNSKAISNHPYSIRAFSNPETIEDENSNKISANNSNADYHSSNSNRNSVYSNKSITTIHPERPPIPTAKNFTSKTIPSFQDKNNDTNKTFNGSTTKDVDAIVNGISQATKLMPSSQGRNIPTIKYTNTESNISINSYNNKDEYADNSNLDDETNTVQTKFTIRNRTRTVSENNTLSYQERSNDININAKSNRNSISADLISTRIHPERPPVPNTSKIINIQTTNSKGDKPISKSNIDLTSNRKSFNGTNLARNGLYSNKDSSLNSFQNPKDSNTTTRSLSSGTNASSEDASARSNTNLKRSGVQLNKQIIHQERPPIPNTNNNRNISSLFSNNSSNRSSIGNNKRTNLYSNRNSVSSKQDTNRLPTPPANSNSIQADLEGKLESLKSDVNSEYPERSSNPKRKSFTTYTERVSSNARRINDYLDSNTNARKEAWEISYASLNNDDGSTSQYKNTDTIYPLKNCVKPPPPNSPPPPHNLPLPLSPPLPRDPPPSRISPSSHIPPPSYIPPKPSQFLPPPSHVPPPPINFNDTTRQNRENNSRKSSSNGSQRSSYFNNDYLNKNPYISDDDDDDDDDDEYLVLKISNGISPLKDTNSNKINTKDRYLNISNENIYPSKNSNTLSPIPKSNRLSPNRDSSNRDSFNGYSDRNSASTYSNRDSSSAYSNSTYSNRNSGNILLNINQSLSNSEPKSYDRLSKHKLSTTESDRYSSSSFDNIQPVNEKQQSSTLNRNSITYSSGHDILSKSNQYPKNSNRYTNCFDIGNELAIRKSPQQLQDNYGSSAGSKNTEALLSNKDSIYNNAQQGFEPNSGFTNNKPHPDLPMMNGRSVVQGNRATREFLLKSSRDSSNTIISTTSNQTDNTTTTEKSLDTDLDLFKRKPSIVVNTAPDIPSKFITSTSNPQTTTSYNSGYSTDSSSSSISESTAGSLSLSASNEAHTPKVNNKFSTNDTLTIDTEYPTLVESPTMSTIHSFTTTQFTTPDPNEKVPSITDKEIAYKMLLHEYFKVEFKEYANYLGSKKNNLILQSFIGLLKPLPSSLLDCLIQLSKSVYLIAESQNLDRILEELSKQYAKQYPDSIFSTHFELYHIVLFSLLILNSNLHTFVGTSSSITVSLSIFIDDTLYALKKECDRKKWDYLELVENVSSDENIKTALAKYYKELELRQLPLYDHEEILKNNSKKHGRAHLAHVNQKAVAHGISNTTSKIKKTTKKSYLLKRSASIATLANSHPTDDGHNRHSGRNSRGKGKSNSRSKTRTTSNSKSAKKINNRRAIKGYSLNEPLLVPFKDLYKKESFDYELVTNHESIWYVDDIIMTPQTIFSAQIQLIPQVQPTQLRIPSGSSLISTSNSSSTSNISKSDLISMETSTRTRSSTSSKRRARSSSRSRVKSHSRSSSASTITSRSVPVGPTISNEENEKKYQTQPQSQSIRKKILSNLFRKPKSSHSQYTDDAVSNNWDTIEISRINSNTVRLSGSYEYVEGSFPSSNIDRVVKVNSDSGPLENDANFGMAIARIIVKEGRLYLFKIPLSSKYPNDLKLQLQENADYLNLIQSENIDLNSLLTFREAHQSFKIYNLKDTIAIAKGSEKVLVEFSDEKTLQFDVSKENAGEIINCINFWSSRTSIPPNLLESSLDDTKQYGWSLPISDTDILVSTWEPPHAHSITMANVVNNKELVECVDDWVNYLSVVKDMMIEHESIEQKIKQIWSKDSMNSNYEIVMKNWNKKTNICTDKLDVVKNIFVY